MLQLRSIDGIQFRPHKKSQGRIQSKNDCQVSIEFQIGKRAG